MVTKIQVPYGYLPIQLQPDQPLGKAILEEWRQELERGFFTLGPAVERLETAWARYCGVKHAIGVNSGTDALIISMKALGIGPGDEVITCPNTFVATVGAIVAVGAKPVFVDSGPNYLLDTEKMAKAINGNTKAVIPVDLTGKPVDDGLRTMFNFGAPPPYIIRDACQSIGALYAGSPSVRWSALAAYSLHPLKNVHACGDGGMIVTDNDDWAAFARLYRNHGLKDRDTVIIPGINSRLDTLQAIAGWHILQDVERITLKRNENATQYREGLAGLEQITLPPVDAGIRQAYHTFVILVERRDELKAWLLEHGVQAAIHYPVPVHLQPGYAYLGYHRGDFPNVEYQADHQISLPIHEYLKEEQIVYVIEQIREFYR